MPCRGSSIGMVKMYRKLIFWRIFIIKMTIETSVEMVNYSQIKQPWFLNERRIKHETINEQIWKQKQFHFVAQKFATKPPTWVFKENPIVFLFWVTINIKLSRDTLFHAFKNRMNNFIFGCISKIIEPSYCLFSCIISAGNRATKCVKITP